MNNLVSQIIEHLIYQKIMHEKGQLALKVIKCSLVLLLIQYLFNFKFNFMQILMIMCFGNYTGAL